MAEKKKLVRKFLTIPIVVGIVVAGVAFGLPLVFSTKKPQSKSDLGSN